MYRLYSLCAIYRLEFGTVLQWYGIALADLAAESAGLSLEQTHVVPFEIPDTAEIDFPAEFEHESDLRQTSYLARHMHRWGKLPLALLSALDLRRHRYAFVGTDDWSMYPVIWPGSFLQIDETKRRVAKEGWAHEHERPIYFIEHRNGFRCGWCAERNGQLIVIPHASSQVAPDIFRFPGEADVIGQVVAVAMRLDLAKQRHTRS